MSYSHPLHPDEQATAWHAFTPIDTAVGSSCGRAIVIGQNAPADCTPSPRARVLVVEDDPCSGRLLQANLTSAGHFVTIVTCALEAQEVALRQPLDLVLCDICLPSMDGIELTRWFRAQAATADVPILLITSSDDGRILSRGLDAGADDFLTKPVNWAELRARIQSLLRSQFFTEELRAQEEAASSFGLAAELPASTPYTDGAARPSVGSILIVEDNLQEVRLLEAHLQEIGHPIRVVHDVRSALDYLAQEVPALVILDLILPDQSGYQLIEHMKQESRWDRVPILVVSGMADVHDRVKALKDGADDFILKGFERIEFDARVRRLLRLKRHWDQLSARCNQALRLAITDSLTGLYTHGFLQESLQRHLAFARRHDRPLSLLFADIDHFKQINDRHGHSAGDEVLKSIAQTLCHIMRRGDVIVRYGGEEFVALLPHTSRAEAHKLAERVRAEIASQSIGIRTADQRGLRVTLSIGVAGFPEDACDAEALLQHADEAMYQAKQAGRNAVALFGAGEAANLAAHRILVVDDDEKNLRLLQAYLVPEGYQTILARDGQEAIEIARHSRPDLVLLDAMMPRLSGFDACRRLKQESATCLVPVVLVTALSSREDRFRGIEAGADDFLRKPIDRVELLTRVRALLRAKRTTDLLEDAETVIFTLARAVEARDPSTGDHVERVSRLAVKLGKSAGLRGAQLEGLRRAAVVHDIGKIVVPDAVLLKPGPLSPQERTIMERHVEAGYELLRPLRTFSESLDAVRFHHERRDGSGYPYGLRGDQIPLSAQIMAIVDIFDALTHERVYRAAQSNEGAFAELRAEGARGLHDPELIELFIATVSQAEVTAGTSSEAAVNQIGSSHGRQNLDASPLFTDRVIKAR